MKDLILKYRKYLFIAAPVFAMFMVGGVAYFAFSHNAPAGDQVAMESAAKEPEKQAKEEEKAGGVGETDVNDHEKQAEKEKEKANITAKKSIQTSAGAKRGSDDDWKLDKPLDKVKFDDPKERELAQRSVIVSLKNKKKSDIAKVKEWDPQIQAKKERAQAIEAWLERDKM
ncbi:MAG: hypothetical protein HZB29_04130 [Nitrospinae bacterium]|nr:hypothetical protein [Nitrospinota bacterium]